MTRFRARNPHPVDRFALSNLPPSILLERHDPHGDPSPRFGPPTLRTVRSLQTQFRVDLNLAFPPGLPHRIGAIPVTHIIHTLDSLAAPFNTDFVSPDYVNAVLELRLLDDLLSAVKLIHRADPTHPPPLRKLLARVLRTLNSLTARSTQLAISLSSNTKALPLIFSVMKSRDVTDAAIGIAEEILHTSSLAPHFHLSSIPTLTDLIQRFTPFQLASFCRTLVSTVDEREERSVSMISPTCPVAAAAAAATAAPTSNDPLAAQHDPLVCGCSPYNAMWTQLESPTQTIRSRRTYLDRNGILARERNVAAILAIPEFLPRLVKLISVPPPSREGMYIIDKSLRYPSIPPVHLDDEDGNGTSTDDISANNIESDGEPDNNDPMAAAQDINLHSAPIHLLVDTFFNHASRSTLRGRVLLAVFRRLTLDREVDAPILAADTWEHIDAAVSEAELEWSQTGFMEYPYSRFSRRPRSPVPLDNLSTSQLPQVTATVPHPRAEVVQPAPTPEQVMSPQLATPASPQAAAVAAQNVPPAGIVDGINDQATAGPSAEGGPNGDMAALPLQALQPVVPAAPATAVVPAVPAAPAAPAAPALTEEPAVPAPVASATSVDTRSTRERARHERERVEKQVKSLVSLVVSALHIEVFYVLNALLEGKRKSEVQRRLLDLGIYPVLNRYFDAMDWRPGTKEGSTESATKTHLTRLMCYLMEGVDNCPSLHKDEILFTETERRVIRTIEDGTLDDKYVLRDVPGIGYSRYRDDSAGRLSRATLDMRPRRRLRAGRRLHFCPLRGDCFICSSGVRVESAPDRWRRDGRERRRTINHERGLLTKMVDVFMSCVHRDETYNTRRFLVSSAMEAFGRTAKISQRTFVGRQGLVRHLLEQIAMSRALTFQRSQFRQTCFDLLGHVLRWDRALFVTTNDLLRGDLEIVNCVLTVVSERLIDSNVFVRSVALSLEYFRVQDLLRDKYGLMEIENDDPNVVLNEVTAAQLGRYDFENCVLWQFLQKYRVRLTFDLMSSVRANDITVENMCCVNTTMLMFVVSCPNEKSLDDLLEEIRRLVECKIREGGDSCDGIDVSKVAAEDLMDNFYRVVDFWLVFYKYRGCDVGALETNSRMGFDRFVKMCGLLRDRLPWVSAQIKQWNRVTDVKEDEQLGAASMLMSVTD